MFAAATAALAAGQSHAVSEARSGYLTAPADLVLDYLGPCTLGGSIEVTGTYTGDGSDEHAAFDLTTKLTGCRELQGTLDGELSWTSVATDTSFTATMKGGLDWEGQNGSASCDFDLTLAISDLGISYGGTLCGYDVATELRLAP